MLKYVYFIHNATQVCFSYMTNPHLLLNKKVETFIFNLKKIHYFLWKTKFVRKYGENNRKNMHKSHILSSV